MRLSDPPYSRPLLVRKPGSTSPALSCAIPPPVQLLYSTSTQNRTRNGVFRNVPQLIQAICDYIDRHNANPATFVWTKKAEDIREKVARARASLHKIPTAGSTTLGDADGTNDPRDHNDRLLLGVTGTMSEADLHLLRNQLMAGRRTSHNAAVSTSRRYTRS